MKWLATTLTGIYVCTLVCISIFLYAPIAYAEDKKANENFIYVPITENFIGFKEKSITIKGTDYPVDNCQQLFKTIQKNAEGSMRSYIKEKKLWEKKDNKFPECFVTGESGVGLISNYLTIIYQWLAGIVGGVAVLMIVIGSIQIASGGGDQNNVTEGKTKIMQAIAGLVVLFLSGLILFTINPTFFG
jgi:hypothetical protein